MTSDMRQDGMECAYIEGAREADPPLLADPLLRSRSSLEG